MTPPRFGPQLDFFGGGGRVSSALAPMTREEIVRGLVAAGVSRAAAERQADREVVSRSIGPITASSSFMRAVARELEKTPDPALVITWPLQLTLPWSYLESDNRKHGAIVTPVGPNRTPVPKLIMAAGYREAKGKIRKLAREQLAGAEPVSRPLQLVARVWIPDTTRKHDVVNFAKCTHDALQEAVYTDDTWLYDARWIRAGVDVDHPRAEITITPLSP